MAEYSAAEDHPVDCRHCWTVANSALGDFLSARITPRSSTRRIDLAVCAIMAHSIAATAEPNLQLYWYEDAS